MLKKVDKVKAKTKVEKEIEIKKVATTVKKTDKPATKKADTIKKVATTKKLATATKKLEIATKNLEKATTNKKTATDKQPISKTKKDVVTNKIVAPAAKKEVATKVVAKPKKEAVTKELTVDNKKNVSTKSKLTAPKKKPKKDAGIDILITTNHGNIEIRVFPDKAPVTVANFLKYISSRSFDNTIFHRVIPNFMIQGGGYNVSLHPIDTLTQIRIESDNGLKNDRGTIAMARTSTPHSATSQFFINLTNNDFLNFKEETIEGYGYTVFGKVISGLDIVDKIGVAQTYTYMHHQNVPVIPVIIRSITQLK